MELIQQLAQGGLLALLLAISYVAIYFLYNRLQASEKEKYTELKEFAEKYLKLADGMKQTLDTTIEVLKSKKK